MNTEIEQIRIGLANIVIFRDILKTKVIKKLIKFLDIYNDNDKIKILDYYSEFIYELFKYNNTISDYILEQIFKDDNIYVNKYIKNENINTALEKALKNELDFFEFLSSFDFNNLFKKEEYSNDIAQLENKNMNFYSVYKDHINNINKKGYGIFYKNNMFTLDDKKNIIPAKHQDMQNIKQLYGYERERSKVITNTKSLLEGKKANNVLLYGDAGTGKSSTIKAIANMFKDDGLRLI